MLTGLALLMSGLLAVVAWIGWRFFITPLRVAMTASGTRAGDSVCIRAPGAESRFPLLRAGAAQLLRMTTLAPILIALSMIGVVLALSERISLDPLQVWDFRDIKHIQSALNPEKLVAPPPLPPSMFVNTERPDLETADRDWARLDPTFMRTVLLVLARVEARGFPMVLLEGYRSPERQDGLAASGTRVTNARAYQSKHQFGLAVDLAPVRDGRLQISERNPWAMQAYTVLGEEADRAGLVWGGAWSLKDYGHIEAAASVGSKAKK